MRRKTLPIHKVNEPHAYIYLTTYAQMEFIKLNARDEINFRKIKLRDCEMTRLPRRSFNHSRYTNCSDLTAENLYEEEEISTRKTAKIRNFSSR